jgi:hypothetical protein
MMNETVSGTNSRMSTVEIIERLNKARAILDVSDARIEHLVWTMDEMVERLRRKDKAFRDELMAEARQEK